MTSPAIAKPTTVNGTDPGSGPDSQAGQSQGCKHHRTERTGIAPGHRAGVSLSAQHGHTVPAAIGGEGEHGSNWCTALEVIAVAVLCCCTDPKTGAQVFE